MIEDTDTGQPEGEVLPETDLATRVTAAIEAWYARHYHAAALAGTAPLSADDKAALIQHVADAVAPPATQE